MKLTFKILIYFTLVSNLFLGQIFLASGQQTEASPWVGPAPTSIPKTPQGKLILYGKALIENTSYYLGPKGKVGVASNGMNCQNCHLEAGTKPWGNNYFGVAALYPKFRARSGGMESIAKRVNDCFQRSLNGKGIDSTSKEMKAIIAYMEWLGTNIPKGTKVGGTGIRDIAFLDRAADPEKGKILFQEKCITCHLPEGTGIKNPATGDYTFPPVWGKNSYNIGAGLFRLSRLAGYIYDNMPQGSSYQARQLSEEQAWDLAAYINTRERPGFDNSKDWPDIGGKPIDHPFGPYKDSFSEAQHKLGPFKSMKK
jgi:thiosulfate dehydrogenase